MYRQSRIQAVNLILKTPVTELTGQLAWNIAGSNYSEKGFAPYLFAGAGFALLGSAATGAVSMIPLFSWSTGDKGRGSLLTLPISSPAYYRSSRWCRCKIFFHPNWGVNAKAHSGLPGLTISMVSARPLILVKDKYFSYTVVLFIVQVRRICWNVPNDEIFNSVTGTYGLFSGILTSLERNNQPIATWLMIRLHKMYGWWNIICRQLELSRVLFPYRTLC